MKPESSLPHLQVPATYPYPEPVWSSPRPHISLPEHPSSYYLPIYAWVFQVVSFPQVSPTKTLYTLLLSTIRATCPVHLILLDTNHIGWAVQIIELLIMQFSPLTVTSSLSGPNILLSTPFSNILSLGSSLNVSDQVSSPYKTIGKIVDLYIFG